MKKILISFLLFNSISLYGMGQSDSETKQRTSGPTAQEMKQSFFSRQQSLERSAYTRQSRLDRAQEKTNCCWQSCCCVCIICCAAFCGHKS